MNCDESMELIPLRDDAGLGGEERRELERHLAGCGACRRDAAALAGPLAALQGVTAPPLSGVEVDRMVSAAMPKASPIATGWLSHAAAVLVGVSVMAAGRGCQDEAPVVERPVERPVEQPIERIVERPVERVVEKIVYRDRPVAHSLQPRLDAQVRAANVFSEAALTGVRLADRIYADRKHRQAAPQMDAPPIEPNVVAQLEPARRESVKRVPVRERPRRTHLEVRRVGGRVTLRTRGTLAEVVPVLIDTLMSEDGAVVAAAVDRLESIRADLGSRAVDLRPEAPPPARRSGIRALLSSRATAIRASEMDDLALWRDWWIRQQATDVSPRASASI